MINSPRRTFPIAVTRDLSTPTGASRGGLPVNSPDDESAEIRGVGIEAGSGEADKVGDRLEVDLGERRDVAPGDAVAGHSSSLGARRRGWQAARASNNKVFANFIELPRVMISKLRFSPGENLHESFVDRGGIITAKPWRRCRLESDRGRLLQMRLLQRSIYAALALTGAFIIGFLHLDSQLSAGSFDNLGVEGAFVLAVALAGAASWAFAYRSYRVELRRRSRRVRRQPAAGSSTTFLKAA